MSRSRTLRRSVTAVAAAVAVVAAVVVATRPTNIVRPEARGTVRSNLTVTRATTFLEGEEEGGKVSAAEFDYTNRAWPNAFIDIAQTQGAIRAARGLATGRGLSAKTQARLAAVPAWEELGPTDPLVPASSTYTGRDTNVSGRTPGLAIAPTCVPGNCRLWAGSAGGGVWRTDDALASRPVWKAVNEGLGTNAIGSLMLDPTDPTGRTIYAGTGEPNGSSDSEAGLGLYRSTNGGDTWQLVRGSQAAALDRSIASIAIDPRDGDHLYIGVAVARHGMASVWGGRNTPPNAPPVGLYESKDGGATWDHVLALEPSPVVDGISWFQGGVNRVELDPNDPDTVFAAAFGYGLWRRSVAVDGDRRFHQVVQTYNPADFTGDRSEFDLVDMGADTRIYLGDSSEDLAYSALFRVDDASVPAADLTDGTHNPGWISLSDPTPGTAGFGSWNFCHGQCGYDQFVNSPPGRPDEVWLGGAMNYDEIFGPAPYRSNGRAVVRSIDAGETWDDMTNDARDPALGMHPDQHEIVWSPNDPRIAFISSDGGLVRVSGRYADTSSTCAARGLSGGDLTNCEDWLEAVPTRIDPINRGLGTVQFQHVSVNPTDSGDLMGGTQDNGTWSNDPNWFETINGDGGHSGYDAGNADIRFHTYYDAYVDVNFRGNDPVGWNWIGDPLYYSKEQRSFYVSMLSDPVRPGYMYVGMEHVWRTTDNGGDQAYLEEHCSEFTGDFAQIRGCGDWKKVGGGPGNGNLTAAVWGDRAGQFISVIERGADRNTLWAGTRTGRVFISKNIATNGSVKFSRLDTPTTPGRFVSDIVVDPANANHAWVAYSGYAAYTPGQPGHIYSVTFNPSTGKASWTLVDDNLGDIPVLALGYDDSSRTLYASYDFGVVKRTAGGWIPAGGGLPPVATYSLAVAPNGDLIAGTHGRGIWRLAG